MKKIKDMRERKERGAIRRTLKKDPDQIFDRINHGITKNTPPGWGHFILMVPLDGGTGKNAHSKNLNGEAVPALLRSIADQMEKTQAEQNADA